MVDTKGIKKQEQKNNSSAVYPFELDVPAFPERKYIAGIARVIRWVYISILISIFLIAFSVFRANDRKIYPNFITYDTKENTFKFIPSSFKNEKNPIVLGDRYYIEESFLKNYLKKRFEITKDIGVNHYNWCDCHDKDGQNKLSKSGIFDLNGRCYLCNVMSDKVFNDFFDFNYGTNFTLSTSGVIRNIEILDIKQINYFETAPQKSFLAKMLDKYILSKNTATTTTAVYKVVFILNTIDKNKSAEEEESFVGFITINGIKDKNEIKKITDESYMFHSIEPGNLRKLYD